MKPTFEEFDDSLFEQLKNIQSAHIAGMRVASELGRKRYICAKCGKLTDEENFNPQNAVCMGCQNENG